MIWLARALRVGLVGACAIVLNGIVPISFTQFRTGSGCPMLGPIPACYIVSVAYAAMALAGIIWWQVRMKLFLFGSVPVIALAMTGTVTELVGVPTCPRSATGLPLCYASLGVGLGLLLLFFVIKALEEKRAQ